MRMTLPAALKNAQEEIRLMGGSNLILSSNVTLGQSNPQDTGVAAYFTLRGKQVCIPCDRWTDVASNLQAIAKTVEALRGIERWGAKHMVDAAFTGFAALPVKATRRTWREVLEITEQHPTAEDINKAVRRLSRSRHPDTPTGSNEAFNELMEAKEQALQSIQ